MPTVEQLQQILEPLFPGLMGVRLLTLEPERVVAELPVRPDLCTAGGILHGGATMAFADTLGAVGTILNLPPGKRTTTTDSSTKFIGGARVDTTVVGESVALHRGRTTMVWQTTIRSAEGKLCAVVTQTQLVLDA
jgi:1,4-dihydroxy-2-naphthoyl-CoA hydrolase